MARITLAEKELAASEIRAPVAGRVVSLNLRGSNIAITPGATLLEIATADRTVVLARLPRLDPVLRAPSRARSSRAPTPAGPTCRVCHPGISRQRNIRDPGAAMFTAGFRLVAPLRPG